MCVNQRASSTPTPALAGSNTGCLCAQSLSGCQLLLRGHAPHDEQLAALLADPHYTTALLWPGEGALEPAQLQELAQARSGGRIALVAIDATWGCAVKMQRKFPEGEGGCEQLWGPSSGQRRDVCGGVHHTRRGR